MSSNAENRRRAVQAARGEVPFDLLLTDAHIVDMATGEIRDADVGIVGDMIASVHPRGSRDDALEHHSAGRIPLAGFDGHPRPPRKLTPAAGALRGNRAGAGHHRRLLGSA